MTWWFAQGFATSLGLIVAIGAQNAFVLRQGLRREHLGPVVAFCAIADALLIAAGIAGLGVLVQQLPSVLAVLRYGGALFLFVYGAMAAKRALTPSQLNPADSPPKSLSACLALVAGFTLLNPHVYLDTVVLLGALAHSTGEPGRPLWFGFGAVVASLSWFTALGYGARFLQPIFAKPSAWRVLDGLIAAMMWTLAASLTIQKS